MYLSSTLLCSVILGGLVAAVQGNPSWGFGDATVTVSGKGSNGGLKEKLTAQKPLAKIVTLGATESLKIILTTQDNGRAKRPHQAFLSIQDTSTGLEVSYALSVKESGKAKVDLSQKDIPVKLVTATQPLQAKLLIASFGSATGYNSHVFNLKLQQDPSNPIPAPDKPLRYGKLEEIHHIFRDDPKSPPKIISVFFTATVLATIPILLLTWMALGANLNHLPSALKSAPVSHPIFFGSIVALEGIFFLYYHSWNLFQTLPAAAAVGALALVSGSRALTEVQERRMAGLR